MSRTFVVGDIHGAHKALEQCLERCGFDFENDTLIALGDYCDGWPHVYECVELLLKIVNLIPLLGNHDAWLRYWLMTGLHPVDWSQGGKGTATSYLRNSRKDEGEFRMFYRYNDNGRQVECYEYADFNFTDVPPSHHDFFRSLHLYYKDDKGRLFVHAGMFNKDLTLKENQAQVASEFFWNRTLWNKALSAKSTKSKMTYAEPLTEIFIGHTSTTLWTTKEIRTLDGIIIPKGDPITEPMHADIIWNLDTGAGGTGRLTIMDVDTHEYWQSDLVNTFYGDYKPR